MDFIPDWAPNLHPMIIHFPIALWMLAVLFDFSLVFRTKEWLRRAAIWMYVIGAISALAAFLSGSQAIDLVSVPMQGEVTASKHSDWAHYTLYYLGGYALLRLFIFWQRLDKKKWVLILLFILGATGMVLVAKTADLGGKLVYKYGVGTAK
ncbi:MULTISPECIES: DUF2231 domain-containing protein [Roseivirga]|jgi:uncharacterized membrane protein|nr:MULTISPECIES: DUF2231 domain-containing protein [Roseivirga]MBO6495522.1 DUF2231 domain-containing protein [Roseivirga sp.]MBO6661696.1 DUF2231 domain-containing protein [Roseivirga sp.]MBO6908319.1 DUF2231 domain-containing protein [Roseivirga sp.]WPZ11214.1 DUF2231 domain-containing protein [Roseivirga spongicola]